MDGKQVELKKVYESQSGREKIVILWVSRHSPLKRQIEVLEKLGALEVWQLSGLIPNAEFVVEKVREVGAKYVVPVLPLSFIARLVELAKREGFIVLWAEMQQVKMLSREPEPGKDYDPDREVWIKGYEGTYKVMRFVRFHKIRAVKLELEPF